MLGDGESGIDHSCLQDVNQVGTFETLAEAQPSNRQGLPPTARQAGAFHDAGVSRGVAAGLDASHLRRAISRLESIEEGANRPAVVVKAEFSRDK